MFSVFISTSESSRMQLWEEWFKWAILVVDPASAGAPTSYKFDSSIDFTVDLDYRAAPLSLIDA